MKIRRSAFSSLAAATMLVIAGSASAASRPVAQPHIGMVQDWSTARAVFRHPVTPNEARAQGRFDRWQRLAADPRYMYSINRRLESEALAADVKAGRLPKGGGGGTTSGKVTIPRDWSNVLGGGTDGDGGTGFQNTYPAKYTFNINATPNCSTDFVVFPTGDAPVASTGASETWTITFTGNPAIEQTVVIGDAAPRSVTLTAWNNLNTGLNFQYTGNTTTNAANLRDAINRWSGQTGYTATSSTNVVTITSATHSDVTTSLVTEGLSNATLGNTAGGGNAGQPSVVAFNQLYNGASPGCNATRTNPAAPNVYWSYNTGGAVHTSPLLSYLDNGAQVAYVQTVAGAAQLVLLKWKSGDGTAAVPVAPAVAATAADYRNGTGLCAGAVACTFKIAFSGVADDTYSSPFVDYFNDVLYVGDDNGVLHRFTGVFSGSPAEAVSSGFPATVSAGNTLSSPVYDFAGGVYVGSEATGANTSEVWHFSFTGNQTVAGGTFIVGGVTFTAVAAASSCTAAGGNFSINAGGANTDGASLRACTALVPGFTTSGGGANVIITRNAAGDVADNTVGEGVGMNNFAAGTHTNGSLATGGQLHRIDASGNVTSSAQLSANNSPGVRAPPLLDVSAGKLIAFVFDDGSATTTSTCTSAPCRGVYQFNTGVSFPGVPVKATPGSGNDATRVQWNGVFDNAWYNSANSTGAIYVCGGAAGNATNTTVWKIALTAGVMSATATVGPQIATGSTGDCSPPNEVKNGANEYLFFAVPDSGTAPNCTGSCMYMYNLTELGKSESWSFLFGASQINGGGSFIVNGITFNAVSDFDTSADITNCTAAGGNWDVYANGAQVHDGQTLRYCTSKVPGFTTSGTNGQVIITRNLSGNVADNLVAEGLDMDQFTLVSHIDGSTSATWDSTAQPRAGLPTDGGTGGIIVDNISSNTGASQIYFQNLSQPSNAIQASQSGLQ